MHGGEEPSPQLREILPPGQRNRLPVFLEGDSVTGRTEFETAVDGHAVLRRGDMVIQADHLDYYQPDDLARARGNVRINRAGDIYEGPLLELKVDAFQGFFNEPRFQLLRNQPW